LLILTSAFTLARHTPAFSPYTYRAVDGLTEKKMVKWPCFQLE